MKNIILILTVVFSFTYICNANYITPKKTNNRDTLGILENILYIIEDEEDEPFDFDHKAYLPEGFNPYDLTDNEADADLWIEEDDNEAFDFDHTKYLPVGFNPSKKFNSLFLNKINWVEEDEADEAFNFDTLTYFKKFKTEVLLSIR